MPAAATSLAPGTGYNSRSRMSNNAEHLAGRYRLEQLLGEGGMGAVHAAFDTLLERQVAIKTLNRGTDLDSEARARFRREALAAAALDHPFICKVYEVGEHDGRSFIVMEYVEGRTLDSVIGDGPVTARQLLDISHEIAQALAEAHRRGIVHRDLKPSNIMLTTHGHVKVLDFGLAKHVDSLSEDGETIAAPSGATRAGTRLGTPAYMSPEQVLGSPLDPRSDVFSLGVVFHELASGQHPFRKATTADTMAAILRDPPASTEGDLDVVPGFGRTVHRMLAKACAARFQSMHDLAGELDAMRERGSSGTPSSGGALAPALREERTQMVARDAELGELTRQLDTMLLGQGGIVLLGGEPGVGKTRLAREMLRLARTRGCFTAIGQCYEQEGAPPFGPLLEIMDQAIRAAPQAVRAAMGEGASELSLIFPALRRAFPDIPPAPSIPAEQQRLAVFNAYLEYMRRASGKSPSVLLIDDLHWADDSTLQSLLHSAPHLSSMRILVLGTYRDVELDTVRPFAKALELLLRQRLASRHAIRRLGAAGVEQMLATMSGSPPPGSLIAAVHAETDGNPFFVEEVFHHLKEEGKLFDADGRWKPGLRVEDLDVPEGVRLVISRRLERLGDEARKLLTAAAVIGRSFPLDLLSAIADLDEDRLFDILEDVTRAQLLQAERGRDVRYTFVHELIRGTLLGAMAMPRRQRMHLRVANALEQLRPSATDAHTSVLAHHLYQAGAAADAGRTIDVLVKAMQRAYASGAFEDVVELADRLGQYELPPGSVVLATVEQARADAFFALGRPAEALATAGRALAIWEQLGHDEGIARAAMLLATIHVWGACAAQALAVLERGLAALSPSSISERCYLEASSVGLLAAAGRFAESRSRLQSAELLAANASDNELLGAVAGHRGRVLWYSGRIRDAFAEWSRALSLLGDSYSNARAEAVIDHLLWLFFTGDYASLNRALADAALLGRRLGHAGLPWIVGMMKASIALGVSGDLEGWRRFNAAELERPVQWRFMSRWFIAETTFLLGDTATALSEMRRAIDERPDPTVWTGRLPEVVLVAMHAWAGQLDQARALWHGVVADMPAADEDHTLGQLLGLYTAIGALALLGDRGSCAALYPAAEKSLQNGLVYTSLAFGPTSPPLAAAIAADAAGLPDRARAHFEDALAIAIRTPIRHLIPAIRLWFGRFLAGQGDDDVSRALTLLTEARDEFGALQMPVHRDYAERWLHDAQVPGAGSLWAK
jgi:tetratricopeptide (TPR) repeat protein/predicted Ser/Thr protein kinase